MFMNKRTSSKNEDERNMSQIEFNIIMVRNGEFFTELKVFVTFT